MALDLVGLLRPPSVGAAMLALLGIAVAAAEVGRHLLGLLGEP